MSFFDIKIPMGGTLSKLAKKYSTTVDDILALNPLIENKDVIQAGATLKIPKLPKDKNPIAYNQAFEAGLAKLFKGDYGKDWAREKLLKELQDIFPEVDVSYDIYTSIPDDWQIAPSLKVVEKVEKGEKDKGVWDSIGSLLNTMLIKPLQPKVQEAVFSLVDYIKEEPTKAQVKEIASKKISEDVADLTATWEIPWQAPPIVKPPQSKISLMIGPKVPVAKEIAKKFTYDNKASIHGLIGEFQEASQAEHAMSTPAVLPTSFAVWNEKYLEGLDEEARKKADPSVAWQDFRSIATELDNTIDNAKTHGMVFIYNDKDEITGFNEDKTAEEIERLVSEKIKEHQKALEKVSPILTKANEGIEENNKLQAEIMRLISLEMDMITDFLSDPENLDAQKMAKFSKELREKFGSPQEFKDLDLALKDLTTFQDAEGEFMETTETMEKESEKIQGELNSLITPEINKFFEDQANIGNLSDESIVKLQTFYDTNKIQIDRVILLSGRVQEIMDWYAINNARLNNLSARSNELSLNISDRLGTVVEYFQSPEFIEGITKYSIAAARPQTELLKALQQFQKNRIWYEENEDKIKSESLSLDDKLKDAQREIDAYMEETNSINNKLFDLSRKLNQAQKDYQGALTAAEFRAWEHQRDIMEGYMHPFKDRFKSWYKHKGESAMGYVGVVFGNIAELPGPKQVFAAFQWWNEDVYRKHILPQMQYFIVGTVMDLSYLHYSLGTSIWKPKDFTKEELKYWKDEGWVARMEQINHWMNIPVEGLEAKVGTAELNRHLLDSFQNPSSYEDLKFKKKTNIKDIIPEGRSLTVLDVMAINPHIKDPYNIPAGTTIRVQRFDPLPKWSNLLTPEFRTVAETKHPIAVQLGNLFFEIVTDPQNIYWGTMMKSASKMGRALKLKGATRLAPLAAKYSWTGKMQGLFEFNSELYRFLRGKNITPEFTQKFASIKVGKKIVIPIPKAVNLASGRAWFMKTTVLKHYPYQARKAANESSGALQDLNKHLMIVEIDDAVRTIGKKYKTAPKDFYQEITNYLGVPWKRPTDAVIEFLNRFNLTSFEFWELGKKFPKAEGILEEILTTYKATKPRAKFVSEMMNENVQRSSALTRDAYFALTRSKGQAAIDAVKDYYRKTFADSADDITKAFHLFDDFVKETERARFLYQNSEEIIKVQDSIQINIVSEAGRKKLKGQRYLVTEQNGIVTFLMDPKVYKAGGLPEMLQDVSAYLVKLRMNNLRKLTAYTLDTSFPVSKWEVQTPGSKKRVRTTIEAQHNYLRGDSYLDSLVTDFRDNFYSKLPTYSRAQLDDILKRLAPDEMVIKQFRYSYQRPWENIREEKLSIGQGAYFANARQMQEIVKEYKTVHAYLETAGGLTWFKDLNPKALSQLKMVLNRVPLNKLTPRLELQKWLLNLDGPIMTQYQKLLLTGEKLTAFQKADLLKQVSKLGKSRAFKYNKTIRDNKMKALTKQGVDPAEMWKELTNIKTSVVWNNQGIEDVAKLKTYSSLNISTKDFNRILGQRKPYLMRYPLEKATIAEVNIRIKDIEKLLKVDPVLHGKMRVNVKELNVELIRLKKLTKIATAERISVKEALSLQIQEELHAKTLTALENLKTAKGQDVTKILKSFNENMETFQNKITTLLSTPDETAKLSILEQRQIALANKQGHIFEVYDITAKDKAFIKYLRSQKITPQILKRPALNTQADILKQLDILKWKPFLSPLNSITDEGLIRLLSAKLDWPEIKFVKKTRSWVMKSPTGKWVSFTPLDRRLFYKNADNFFSVLKKELKKTSSGREWLTEILGKDKMDGIIPRTFVEAHEELRKLQDLFSSPKPKRGLSKMEHLGLKPTLVAKRISSLSDYISRMEDFVSGWNSRLDMSLNALGLKSIKIVESIKVPSKILKIEPMNTLLREHELLQELALRHSGVKNWIGKVYPRVKNRILKEELPKGITFEGHDFLKRYVDVTNISYYKNTRAWKKAFQKQEKLRALKIRAVELELKLKKASMELDVVKGSLNEIYTLPRLKEKLASTDTSEYFERMGMPIKKIVSDKVALSRRIKAIEKFSKNKKIYIKHEADLWRSIKNLTDDLDDVHRRINSSSGSIEDLLSFVGAERAGLLQEEGLLIKALDGKRPLTSDFIAKIDKKIASLTDDLNHPLRIQEDILRSLTPKVISSIELKQKLIAKIASIENDIVRLENLKEIAVPFQMAVTRNLLPTADEGWQFSKSQTMTPELEAKMKSLASLIEPTKGKKVIENLIDEFPDLKTKLPEVTIKGKSIDSMAKEYLVGDILDPKKALPEIHIWSPDVVNIGLTPMRFEAGRILDTLQDAGAVYTARGYLMKSKDVWVDGIGNCSRKFLKKIDSAADLRPYLALSGFGSIDDWWRDIQKYVKGRDWTPLDDLLKAKPAELKMAGRKALTSFDYLAKQLGIGFTPTDYSDVVIKGIMTPALRGKIGKVIETVKKKKPKGTWMYKITKKTTPIDSHSVFEVLRKWDKEGIKVVLDQTGLLKKPPFSDYKFGFKVVSLEDLLPKGEDLTWFTKKVGDIASNAEIAVQTQLRKIFWDTKKVGIIGKDDFPKLLKDNFYARYLTPNERAFLEGAMKDFRDYQKLARGEAMPGYPFMYPSAQTRWTIELSPAETVAKLRPMVEREYTLHQARNYLDKAGWVNKKLRTEDPFKNGTVLLLAQDSTIISSRFRRLLNEAIKRKTKFYLPEKMNQGEKIIAELLDIKKISYTQISLSQKNISALYSGVSDTIPYFIMPSSLGLRGSRFKILQTMQNRNRVMKSFDIMKKEMIAEFTDAIKAWNKDINKFPPDYVTDQVVKWGKGYREGNVKDALARWIKLNKRIDIKENWFKQKQFILEGFEETMRKELMRVGKRNYLLDIEKVSVAKELSRLKQALKDLDDFVFKWDKGMTYAENMRAKISQRLGYFYLKQSDSYGIGALPIELDKLNAAKLKMADVLFWDLPHYLKIPKAISGVARSVWVNLVLFWRLGWHVWNNLDDGLRASMASKNIGDFFRIQMAYTDLSLKFLKHWGDDFVKTVLEATDFYKLAPKLQEEAIQFLGPKYGTYIANDIAETASKKAFRPFNIEDYYKVKKTGMFGQMQEWMYRHYIRDTLDWKSATTRTKAGEMMQPTDVRYIASQGLYSTVGDPVATGRIISMLDETTWGRRIYKRMSVMDADLKLFADAGEELRRLMCAHTLLFDQAMSIAKAEARVKKLLFDYSDLTVVGQTFRIIFPFYTFNAKSIQLYLGMCLKQGYRTYSAGKALLKAWSLTAKKMPEGYQDRVKIGNEVWWSPHFSIVEFWNLIKDPEMAVAEFIDNPLRTIGGFGWDPFLAEFIKRAQGGGYFALSTHLKRTTGWTQWEIDNYLKDQRIIDKDLSTAPGKWGEFVLQFVPIAPFIKSLFELDETLIMREGSLLNSRVLRELLKFCGLNIKKYDDIERLRYIYFDLPPRLRSDWVRDMKVDNPDLYKMWRDYFLSTTLANIMHAKGAERIRLVQKYEEQWYIDTFYSLEDKKSGNGYEWLNKNTRAHAVMRNHWKSLTLTPWRMESLRIHTEKILKARVKVWMDSIPATMDEEKMQKMTILGIESPYTGAFTKQELRDDFFDKYGNLKVGSIEEFNLLLQGKGWIDKGLSSLKSDIIRKADQLYLEWQIMSRQAKENKKWEDALYYHRLSTIYSILPKGISDMPEAQQQKYWDEWRNAFDTKLTDEQRLRYMTSLPEIQRQYLEAMEKYNAIWQEIFPNFGKEDFDFFKIFYSQPKWFQDLYFLKHRNKATWYPFAAQWIAMIIAIEKKEEKTGTFQTEDRKEASAFFWSHEDLIKAWDKDNPRFYEYMKIWKTIFDKPDDNMDYFETFYSQPQWFQDRFFKKNPEKKEYYNFISKWLELLEEDEATYQETGVRANKASKWFWNKNNKVQRDLYGNKKVDATHTKYDYLKVWERVITRTEENVEDYFLYFYEQDPWFKNYFFSTHPDQAIYYPVIDQWRKLIKEDQTYLENTGERGTKARDFFEQKIKGDPKVRSAWENQNKGIIDYLSTWSKIMDMVEDNPELYFDEFYSQPKAFRDRFFRSNKGKAVYYPVLQKWCEAIRLDKKNLENGKKTHVARDYFNSWKNTLAGKLYAKDNMITSDKSVVDYLNLWQVVMEHTEEKPKEFFEVFDKQPQWFKDHYFKNHPERKIYYPFAKELGKQSSENFSKFFWNSKYSKEREAWEKDKPGFLPYMKFWKDLSNYADNGDWDGYFKFYYSSTNKEYRDRHWANNPDAESRYNAFRTYSTMPSMTWEERKAKRDFLKQNPQLLEWWSEDLSEEDAKTRTKVEHYFELLDNIKADGIGREYFLEYKKWKAAADHYLKMNPEVLLFLQKKPKEYTGEKAIIFSLIASYNNLTFPEEKEKFLNSHPELADYFLNSNPPGIRAILNIQGAYFDLPTEKKAAYLKEHPELIDWWEISKLPWSYYFAPERFRSYENAISKIDKAFAFYTKGIWKTAESLRLSLPDIYTNPGESEEDDWFKNKAYKLAMETWVKTIGRNEFMGVYFFRQLPRWIRDQYYSKHPEKRYLSTEPLARFLEEPLRVWAKLHPDVAWAYYELYKYGKNIPAAIKDKVTEIFQKHGIWSSRYDWSQKDWQDYWKRRTLALNEVKEFDYNNLPLLRSELNKVIKTFPLRVTPNIFGKPRIGVITPFFLYFLTILTSLILGF